MMLGIAHSESHDFAIGHVGKSNHPFSRAMGLLVLGVWKLRLTPNSDPPVSWELVID